MAIPTGNIRSVKTTKGFGLKNNILEDFIDGMADMDFTIGIWRSIMQNEFGFIMIFFAATAYKGLAPANALTLLAHDWASRLSLESQSQEDLKSVCSRPQNVSLSSNNKALDYTGFSR
jgi:hypothetical protein